MNYSPSTPGGPGESGAIDVQLLCCSVCRRWIHPVERDCAEHPGMAAPETVTGNGTVYSFTVNHHAYLPDIDLPYAVAMIDLDPPSSLRVTARVIAIEADTVRIGTRVRAAGSTHGTRVPTFEVIT